MMICWHRWTRWTYSDEGCNLVSISYRKDEIFRHKECVKCGKVKVEKIK